MTINQPSVSVIIPAYNAEEFIGDAVSSVLSQTAGVEQVIVVDDGSVDSTAEVVKGFGPKVACVSQANAGVAAARNTGLELVTSDLVAFLDADDVWLPAKLQAQLDLLARQPDLGLVYCGWQFVTEDLTPRGEPTVVPDGSALRNTLLMEPPGIWFSSTALIPKVVLMAVGGFDERLSTSADMDIAVRVAAQYPSAGIPEPLVLYRQHAGQMHLDPDATARDMEMVYLKAFSATSALSRDLKELESRARANLNTTLGLAYLRHRRWAAAARRFRLALRLHPLQACRVLLLVAIRKLVRWPSG